MAEIQLKPNQVQPPSGLGISTINITVGQNFILSVRLQSKLDS